MAEKNMDADINVEFEESASRQQLNSGENITTLFGKIRKFFSDLKAVAFSGSYNDLSDTPESLPANGGNADTLSSKSIDYFMHWRNETIVNPDDVTDIGIYQWSASTTNTIDPIAYGTLIVSNAFGYKCQIAISVDTSVYIRHKTYDQEWSSWRNIADADTLDGLHAAAFMRYEPDKSLVTSINDMLTSGTYGVYTATPDFPTGYGTWGLLEVQVYGSICYQIIRFETGTIINRAKIVGQTEWSEWKRLCDGGNADTVDGLHANDFVNATNRNNIQIPSNVDVPAWIHANGKRYQLYMTNDGNIGMTNIPNDSTDWVWYWFDSVNIIAREWATGKYYICDTINGGFSGWKDIYTSGYKPYVTGEFSCGDLVTATIKDYQIFNFTPSAVICQIANGSAFFATTIQNGFRLSLTPHHNGQILKYIAFK